MQLCGDIPLRWETLDPLDSKWHDGGLSEMTLRGTEWVDVVIHSSERGNVGPSGMLSGMMVDSQR